MPCFFPLTAYRGRETNPETGKRPLAFKSTDGYYDTQLKIGCGQCRGCRRDRARQWAIRCVHEASQYQNNCFITLTFNEKHLNSTGTLVKRDFQLFMKRLRVFAARNVYDKEKCEYVPLKRKHWIRPSPLIKYFHCGEYGTDFGRPHHHACLFNFAFSDKTHWKTKNGIPLYRSPALERLWSHPSTGDSYGYSTVGDVTYNSAAYVAGYVLKKITGDKAPDHYQGRLPEYCTMSRRPGIGNGWFQKYASDIAANGGVLVMPGGFKHKNPKYYDKQFELTEPSTYAQIKAVRVMNSRGNPDSEQDRLYVRSLVEDGRYALKLRPLE